MTNSLAGSHHVGRFIRSEDGDMPVFGFFVALTIIVVMGLAIDGNRAFETKAQLRATADAAASAAIVDISDETAARASAIDFANRNASMESDGDLVTEGDVEIGFWDPETRSFVPDGAPRNAVRVTARRSGANGNPVPTYFLRVAGFNYWHIASETIAMAKQECFGGGLFTEGAMTAGNGNTIPTGFCMYGRGSLTIGNTNTVIRGGTLMTGDLGDFVQGSGNTGVEDALKTGRKDLPMLNKINSVTANMRSGDLPAYTPDWITNVVELPRIKRKTPLQPNTMYRVDGNVDLGANRDLENIVIAATGDITTGSNVRMENVFFTSFGNITFNSNNDFGSVDYCSEGTFGVHVFARGDVDFGSNNRLRGLVTGSLGTIRFGSNTQGLNAVHMEAKDEIFFRNANGISTCQNKLSSPLVPPEDEPFVTAKIVK